MKKTYAQTASMLAAKESKYQKMLDSATTDAEKNTAQLMLERVQASKEQLIEDNRSAAAAMEGEGDGIPSFALGGDPPGTNRSARNQRNRDFLKSLPFLLPIALDDMVSFGANSVQIPEENIDIPRYPSFYTPTDVEDYSVPHTLRTGPSNPDIMGPFNVKQPVRISNTLPSSISAATTTAARSGNNAKSYTSLPKLDKVDTQTFRYAGEEPSIETSDISISDILAPQAQSDSPGFLSRLFERSGNGGSQGNILDTGLGIAGSVAPFIDNFAFSKYKNSVQGDATPQLYTAPRMETTYDIAPELAEARTGQRVLNKSLDRSNTNRGTSNANKVAGLSERIRSTGSLLSKKSNTERSLRNSASQVLAANRNRNTDVINQHAQDNVDFDNQKAYMDYMQAVNLSEDLGNINEQNLRKKEQEEMLRILAPYYNMNGLMSKYASQFSPYLNTTTAQ